jgi:hypothetical protein
LANLATGSQSNYVGASQLPQTQQSTGMLGSIGNLLGGAGSLMSGMGSGGGASTATASRGSSAGTQNYLNSMGIG